MTPLDFLKIRTANPKQLEDLLARYHIRPSGPEGFLMVHRSVKNPHTGRVVSFKRSARTKDPREALIKLIPLIEAWEVQAQSPTAPVLRVDEGKLALLETLLAEYIAGPALVKAKPAARKRNAASLRIVLREVYGELGEAAAVGLISGEAAKAFQEKRKAAAELETDKLARDAKLRAANGTLKQAQCVVSRRALADTKLALVRDACRAFNERPLIPVDKAPEPEPLTDEVIARLRAAADVLPRREVAVKISGAVGQPPVVVRVPGLHVWTAFQIMVWTGCRNIEVEHARLNWLQDDGGTWRLRLLKTADWAPKGHDRKVPIPAALVEELRALPRAEGDDHLVPARTPLERHTVCYRAINAWLAEQGVERSGAGKIAYRLRAYYLNMVREETQRHMEAVAKAAAAAGHADSGATLLASYVSRPKLAAPVVLPDAKG